jgi:hypothetical protein
MPTPTYTPLATITLSSSASTVTFGSIPNTYKDLVLVVTSAAGNTGAPGGNSRNLLMRFNGDTSNSYTRVIMSGDGSTARSTSDTQSWFSLDWYGHTNNATHDHLIQVMDYSATDKHKTVLTRVRSTAATEAMASRWPSTSAVATISIFYDSNTLASGSTFSLFGISG